MSLAEQAKHVAELTLQKIKTATGSVPGRANLENRHMLASSGFTPGKRFSVDVKSDRVVCRLDEDGDNTVSPKVFKLRSGEVTGSRVDVRRKEIAENFSGAGKMIVFYLERALVITLAPTAINNKRRIETLKKAVEMGRISTFAAYSGIGTLDAALHNGFAKAGIVTSLTGANDCWDKAIHSVLADNPAATKETRGIAMGIEQLCAMGGSLLRNVDMVTAGILCKGASKLNTKTRELPEKHKIAGHQVLNFVMMLQSTGWSVPLVLVENVLAWCGTVSCSMLERVLEEQGYDVVFIGDRDGEMYKGLDSSQYGEIEKRVRMCMLAYPKGLGEFDMSELAGLRVGNSDKTIADIRLDEALIDEVDYDKGQNLFSEQKRAKGWKTRVMDDSSNVTPSLSSECYKQRVEDPRFKHPNPKDNRSRLPVPEEHAALKGTDVALIDSMPHMSHAHTALGNGVAKGPWVATGYVIAVNLYRWFGKQAASLTAQQASLLAA